MQKTIKLFSFGTMISLILTLIAPLAQSYIEEGYSIFHETMADMTWQEVEKGDSLGYFGDPASLNIDGAKEYHEAFCKMIADAIEKEIKTNK